MNETILMGLQRMDVYDHHNVYLWVEGLLEGNMIWIWFNAY